MKKRLYNSEEDYEKIRKMLIDNYSTKGYSRYYTIGDMDFCRYVGESDPEIMNSAMLWFDSNNELAGFAWPDDEHLDIITHYKHRQLEIEIIQWAENLMKDNNPGGEQSQTVYSYKTDSDRNSILNDLGYSPSGEKEENRYLGFRNITKLSEKYKKENWYTIRLINPETDLKRRVELNLVAMDEDVEEQNYFNLYKAPSYKRELDFVAVDNSTKNVIAFLTVWYDQGNKTAIYEPFGCDKKFRRKGIMK